MFHPRASCRARDRALLYVSSATNPLQLQAPCSHIVPAGLGRRKRTRNIFSPGTSFKLAIGHTSPYIYRITDQTLGVSG